jgi:hypothetical protein
LARRAYGKPESKMTSAKDFAAPAQAVLEDLGDRDYAASVYAGAEEKLSAPKELIILADEVMRNLKDQERAVTLDEQAARECMTGTAYVQLANRLRQYGLDRDILRRIYAIGKRKSQGAPEAFALGKRDFRCSAGFAVGIGSVWRAGEVHDF